MQIEFARKLEQAAQGTDNELTVREDYSGRSMFGKTTAAVVLDGGLTDLIPTIALVAFEAGENGEDFWDMHEDIASLRTDSMGRGTVVY